MFSIFYCYEQWMKFGGFWVCVLPPFEENCLAEVADIYNKKSKNLRQTIFFELLFVKLWDCLHFIYLHIMYITLITNSRIIVVCRPIISCMTWTIVSFELLSFRKIHCYLLLQKERAKRFLKVKILICGRIKLNDYSKIYNPFPIFFISF